MVATSARSSSARSSPARFPSGPPTPAMAASNGTSKVARPHPDPLFHLPAKEFSMAQIGQFTRTQTGYAGRVRTLSLDLAVVLLPVDNTDIENAPDYRIRA